MVHALQEAHRVIQPGGRLVDLRPLSQDVGVELVGPDGAAYVGEIDESQWQAADEETHVQVARAIRRGLFRPEGQTQIGFHWYFDTLDDFVEYITEQWEDTLDDAMLTRMAERLSASRPGTRIRVHKLLHLAWYVKS